MEQKINEKDFTKAFKELQANVKANEYCQKLNNDLENSFNALGKGYNFDDYSPCVYLVEDISTLSKMISSGELSGQQSTKVQNAIDSTMNQLHKKLYLDIMICGQMAPFRTDLVKDSYQINEVYNEFEGSEFKASTEFIDLCNKTDPDATENAINYLAKDVIRGLKSIYKALSSDSTFKTVEDPTRRHLHQTYYANRICDSSQTFIETVEPYLKEEIRTGLETALESLEDKIQDIIRDDGEIFHQAVEVYNTGGIDFIKKYSSVNPEAVMDTIQKFSKEKMDEGIARE